MMVDMYLASRSDIGASKENSMHQVRNSRCERGYYYYNALANKGAIRMIL